MPAKKTEPTAAPTLDDDDLVTLAANVEEVRQDAMATFSLEERLEGFHHRTAKIVLFTKPEDAELYAQMQARLEQAQQALAAMEAGTPQHQRLIEVYTEAEEEAIAQREVMMQSALAVHMQGVPDVAFEKSRRAARKVVGVKGGAIPEDVQDTYVQAQTDALLGMVIRQVIDATGARADFDPKTVGQTLRRTLPIPQHDRLIRAFNLLTFNDAIGTQATADPGF